MTWNSSDTSIATIDAKTGAVSTSYKKGIVTFTATSTSNSEIKGNITCELFFDITKKEYKFTGKEEEYPVPADGTYTISVYGAQGGGENGGKGGFVKTEIKLNKGEKLN